MATNIALIGNPNAGKTTLFNALTGSNQHVGNWPGVTIERKEGKIKDFPEAFIHDLPGIYSLSPYSPEEIITREFLLNVKTSERPEVVINIIDSTNFERNIYLTSQILEVGIPVVIALNMTDILMENGDTIDKEKLGNTLGCPVITISALKNMNIKEVAELAIKHSQIKDYHAKYSKFDDSLESKLNEISEMIKNLVPANQLRWYTIKLFERDQYITEKIGLSTGQLTKIEELIKESEKEYDDDAESIITNARYINITEITKECMTKKARDFHDTISDKIDRIVTHRIFALPIFALVMFLVYFISITTLGADATDFTNDVFFGEWVLPAVEEGLESMEITEWLVSLTVDGIVGGVGAVLGFVPQMLILFFLLAILEECGYMARVAFIMDRLFRKFGLSGKSFIPMLVSSGCGVPGVMASRTISQERDRKITIMTTTFVPCGAKMPIVALFAGVVFADAWWVAPSAYFLGLFAIVTSGIILKKLKVFAGDPAPFIMELPSYHMPAPKNILITTAERGWSFIRRAGTVILVASVVIWFLASIGHTDEGLGMVEDMDHSILADLGGIVAPLLAPLGFGTWQAAVATVMGLVAKEEVVGVFGVLFGVAGDALELVDEGDVDALSPIAAHFTMLSAYSFLVFNLLCAPCFAAIGAIKREMNNPNWTFFAIAYLTGFAYAISLMVYQFGLFLTEGVFGIGTIAAILVLVGFIYLLIRKQPEATAYYIPNNMTSSH